MFKNVLVLSLINLVGVYGCAEFLIFLNGGLTSRSAENASYLVILDLNTTLDSRVSSEFIEQA